LYAPYYLWGKVDKKTLDFTLWYSPKDKQKNAKHLNFVCKDSCNHGFIIYSVELDDKDQKDTFLHPLRRGELIPSLYNYIKEHFHEHEHHCSSEDALLLCMWLEEPLSLKSLEHKHRIADFYLQLYEDKFRHSLEDIRGKHARILEIMDDWRGTYKGLGQFQKALISGRTTLGEFEFCEFLMQHYTAGRREKNRAIRNTMDAFRRELENVNFDYGLCSDSYNARAARFGKWTGIIGIIVGLLGLAVSFFSLFKNDFSFIIPQEEENTREIQLLHGKVDSLIQMSSQPAADSTKAAPGE